MSQTLQNVLEEIKILSSKELAQLHQEVGKLVQPNAQKAFLEKLKASGLIGEIKEATDQSPTERINVEGKPVSQTIIEERR